MGAFVCLEASEARAGAVAGHPGRMEARVASPRRPSVYLDARIIAVERGTPVEAPSWLIEMPRANLGTGARQDGWSFPMTAGPAS